MNFKEVYSAANNAVKADRSLIEKIEHKAAYKPDRKKGFFIPAYACGCALAAAALIIGVFSYPGFFAGDNASLTDETAIYTDNGVSADSADAADIYEDSAPSASAGNEKEKSPSLQRSMADAPPQELPKAEEKYDAAGLGESAQEDENQANVLMQAKLESAPQDLNESILIFNDNTSDRQYAGSAGGASLDAAYKQEKESTFTAVSADEYGELMGINVLSEAHLPGDMSFENAGDIVIEKDTATGKVISDRAVFYAASQKDGRYIRFTVESQNPEVQSAVNNAEYKKSNIAGAVIVVLSGENEFEAYIRASKADICVHAENITKEEFEEAVVSIVK